MLFTFRRELISYLFCWVLLSRFWQLVLRLCIHDLLFLLRVVFLSDCCSLVGLLLLIFHGLVFSIVDLNIFSSPFWPISFRKSTKSLEALTEISTKSSSSPKNTASMDYVPIVILLLFHPLDYESVSEVRARLLNVLVLMVVWYANNSL